MTDKLVQDMVSILERNGITPQAIEKALRQFHEKHSYNKNVVISYWMDALRKLETKAYRKFRERL